MGSPADSAQILYDADCGFCRWSLGWLLRWDRRRALEPVALQDPLADELLGEIAPARRMDSWHLVADDGSVVSAGPAAAPLLRLLRGGAPLAWLFEHAPRLVESTYARVTAVRGTLGRRVTDRALERADRLIAERRPARGPNRLP